MALMVVEQLGSEMPQCACLTALGKDIIDHLHAV